MFMFRVTCNLLLLVYNIMISEQLSQRSIILYYLVVIVSLCIVCVYGRF